MCIRDRAVCDARQAELLQYYLEAWQGLFAPGSLQGTVPVSYTHLDVYKRQAFTAPLAKMLRE